jgi:hypothetical protein
LDEVSKLSWINKSRAVLHIADAPCHGKRFHSGVNDDHLNGDPKGLQIKDLLTDISNRKILYFFTEINTITQKMIEEFNKELEQIENGNQIRTFKLNSAEDLTTAFISTVTLTIENTRSITLNSNPGVLKDKIINKENRNFEISSLKEHEAEILEFEFDGDLNTIKDLMKKYIDKNSDKKLENFMKIKRETTQVFLCDEPFAKGNLRFAYSALVKRSNKLEKFVAKNSLYKDEKKDSYQNFKQMIILQIIAKYLAETFIKDSKSQMSVKFLNIYIMQLTDTGEYYTIEEYLDGNFAKWSNNLGYVNENEYSYTLDAFSHWSYAKTDHYLVVSDLQGLKKEAREKEGTYVLTDPAISCVERQFTSTDLGLIGIDKFFEKHKCNFMCRQLTLERHPNQPNEDRITTSKATKIK